MNYLLAFSLPVVLAILWRMGGAAGIPKGWRRIGAPIALGFWALFSGVTWYYIPAACLILWVATILPITLIGDDLKQAGQLYWWIPILCLIHNASLIPLGLLDRWLVAVAACVVVTLFQWVLILGSHKEDSIKWHWYETLYGALLGLGAIIVVWSGV